MQTAAKEKTFLLIFAIASALFVCAPAIASSTHASTAENRVELFLLDGQNRVGQQAIDSANRVENYDSPWGVALESSVAPRTGVAIVQKHKGNPLHVSIDVVQDGASRHTHQVVFSADGSVTRIVQTSEVPVGKVVASAKVDLPDAIRGMARQAELEAIPNLGQYDKIVNSCVSHVCDVLKAGGAKVPNPDGSAQLRFLLNLLKGKK